MSLWFSAVASSVRTGGPLVLAGLRPQALQPPSSWAPSSRQRASALVATAAALTLGRRAFKGTTHRRRARHIHRLATPVDYYGLLGLSKFESDRNEIKAAHRRVVRLVHPDVLGGDSAELLRLVTEAYATLSDDAARAQYDATLGCGSGNHGFFRSKWHPEAPETGKALFIDQSQCVSCLTCTDMAGDTFKMDYDGRGRAHVYQQYGDWEEDIQGAVDSCPTRCIHFVERDDLPFLEEAMENCELLDVNVVARVRSGNMAGPPQQSPFNEYQRLKAKAQRTGSPGSGATSASATSHDQISEAIRSAVSAIPEEARERAWPEESA